MSLRRLRYWAGPLGPWIVNAPVGTVRYRLCMSVLLARRAPTLASQGHLMIATLLSPLRDRIPWLRNRWQTVRLSEPPHDVSWTVGPATDFDVLNEILVLGEYDALTLDSPAVIIDIGSHIGASILRLRAAYPSARIFGFEPDPATYSRLVRNVRQLTDVTVLPWAIGERDGYASFYPRQQSWTSSGRPGDDSGHCVTVESVTLDTALARVGVRDVDLVKIDVEGAEATILRRFHGLSRLPMLVGELHGASLCEEVLQLLADFEVTTRGHPDHCHFRAWA